MNANNALADINNVFVDFLLGSTVIIVIADGCGRSMRSGRVNTQVWSWGCPVNAHSTGGVWCHLSCCHYLCVPCWKLASSYLSIEQICILLFSETLHAHAIALAEQWCERLERNVEAIVKKSWKCTFMQSFSTRLMGSASHKTWKEGLLLK